MSPDNPLALTASELRGRRIYAREGCAYCHTQQVRYLENDTMRFGAATLAWETNFDYPHLWGTRRIGPDLARESGVRSRDWHLAHLFQPRSLAPDSVMPRFPHLFAGAPDRPGQEALDLVAYLETLGRARELGGAAAEDRARSACEDCSEDVVRLGLDASVNTHPARARPGGGYPLLQASADLERGRVVYRQNCAGCHGDEGKGDGPGAAGLLPKPSNLAEHEYSIAGLSKALWNGSAGTSMPAWRDLPQSDLAAVAAVVRGFHAPQPEPELTPDILTLGERVYREHCAQCHGDTGAGDGSAADQFTVAPTNFRTQRPALAASLNAVREGVPGTEMGAWSFKLPQAEVTAAAFFARTFYQGDQQ
jgi:mono/diheme cytochrome c family protein